MLSRWILFASLTASFAFAPGEAFSQAHRRRRGRRAQPAATASPAPANTAPASSAPPPATPQEVEARAHFERGVALFQAQDFDGALAEFQAAYDISHRPTVLYNLGVAHQALHHYPEAARAIERYLREATITPERRAQVEQGLVEIRNFIAHITLAGLPDGATVSIDGESAGTAPFTTPIAVGTGRHVIVAHLEGYRDAQESLLIAGGQEREVRIELRPVASAAAPSGATLAVHGAPPGASIEIDGHAAPAEMPQPVTPGDHAIRVRAPGYVGFEGRVSVSPDAHRIATVRLGAAQRMSVAPFAVFTGLTVASGIAMAIMGVVTENTGAQFRQLTQASPDAQSLAATGVTQRTVTNVLIGSTAVFGVAAIVSGFLYFRASGRAQSTVDIAAAPRPEGGGEAVVRVRF